MLNTENIQSLIDSEEGYNVKFKVCVPSKIRELTEDLPMSVFATDYYSIFCK